MARKRQHRISDKVSEILMDRIEAERKAKKQAERMADPVFTALLTALERLTDACKKSHDFCCLDGQFTAEVDQAIAAIKAAKGED